MKLLLVSHTISLWTQHYARYFSQRGDQLLIVSMTPDAIDAAPMEFIGVEPFRRNGNKHLYLTRVPRLRRIIKRFQPDVVFAPYISSNGLMAALAGSGPLVVSGLGSDVLVGTQGGSPANFLRRQLVRFTCSRATAIHVVSANIEDRLLSFGVPGEKIHRFPLGIDTQRFHPGDEPAHLLGRRLICVRKHEPIYDIATILRALARLRDKGAEFHCTFIGGGTMLDENRRLAGELKLNDRVVLLGNVPYDELPNYLRQAGIYISAARSDGTSSALLEAMATGLLPVVTDIDANTPWVAHRRTGLLFQPGNDRQLAEELEFALSEPEQLRGAIELNRQRVLRDGDQEKNDQRLAAILADAAAQTRSNRKANP
jgi:glycosyltransferase involved in cell wall biosynthesis